MKALLLTLLAASLALAGCTSMDESADERTGDGQPADTATEVHGTVEVVDNSSSGGNATSSSNGTSSG